MNPYFFIQWDATSRCNLFCKHCYHTKEERQTRPEMTNKQAKNMMDDLSQTTKRWGMSGGIHFSGGEPLLREDIFDLFDYAKNQGLATRVLSNGTLIDAKMAKNIKKHGINHVQISLDGIKETHNYIRQSEQAFELSMQAIKHLKEENIFVILSTTLTKNNANQLEDIVKIAAESGADKIGFSSLVPEGSGAQLDYLSKEETMHIHQELDILSKKYDDQINIIKSGVLWRLLTPENEIQAMGRQLNKLCGGCAVGYSGFAVLSDGIVYPCRRLPIKIGNILEDNVSDIFINSKVLEDCRDTTKIKGCSDCEKVTYCRGCRALAYAINGNYLSHDPQCFKELIKND